MARVTPVADEVEFVRDPAWRRLDARTVLAGSPLTLFRVTAAGAAVLDALEQGSPPPVGHGALTRRLVAAGALHPLPTSGTPGLHDVTAVIPVHGEPSGAVEALVARLDGLGGSVVVDDASPSPCPPIAGAEIMRLPENRGPAGARNAALGRVTTPFVLFVDADARIEPDAIGMLLDHFGDDQVAAVAPRIRPPESTSNRAYLRYEAVRSPLDMGVAPALVRPGSRVSYVPTAVLLLRTEVLRAVGGFDESLRFGEDVDLIWRLVDAGWRCRYEPRAAATHAPRPSLRDWAQQRASYGSAAAVLDERHPGSVAPARLTGWSIAAWASGASGHLVTAAALGLAGSARLARSLTGRAVAPAAAMRVASATTMHAGLQLADATISVWWPFALLGALVSRRLRWAVAVAAVVPGAIEWTTRHPRLDPVRYIALRTTDRAAYGAGVWRGVVTARRLGPLVPRIERGQRASPRR